VILNLTRVLNLVGILLYTYTINNNDNNTSHEITIPSYNTTNLTNTGDIFLYGIIPFRYISVTCTTGNIILNKLSLYLCNNIFIFIKM
jgi:hypothetical protein